MAVDVDDLRARLKAGETLDPDTLKGAKLKGADLSLLSLDGFDLSGADLRGANLSGASLKGATLKGAKLQGANFQKTDLSQAKLERARLGNIDLRGADLSHANLPRLSLGQASLDGATFDNAALQDADLAGASIKGVSFRGSDLHRATLDGSSLTDVILEGATLSEAFLERVQFIQCDLGSASFKGASAGRSTFKGCQLLGTNLERGDFSEARFEGCDLTRANLEEGLFDRGRFKDCILKDVEVRGADFQGVQGLDDDTLQALESQGAVVHGLQLAALLGGLAESRLFRRVAAAALIALGVAFFIYYMAPSQQPQDAVLDRALELRQEGDGEGALALYDALMIRGEGDEDTINRLTLLRAETLSELGRHEEASAIFSAMAERPGQSVDEAVDAKLRLAAVKVDEGAFPQAIPILEAVAASPDTAHRDIARALIALSSLYERMGFPDKALSVAREALSDEGAHPEVTLAVNRHIANLLVHAGQYEDAQSLLKALEAFVHDDSARAELLISQARLYSAMGEEAKSVEAMAKLERDFPNNPEISPEVRMELGQLFGERGELDAAERILRSLMADQEKGSLANQAALAYATLLSDNGQHKKGLETLDEVIDTTTLPPEDQGLLAITRASLLARVGEAEEALLVLEPAVKDPALGQVGAALLSKAQLLQELDRHGEAEAVLQDVLTRFGGVADMASAANMGLGRSLVELGRNDDALALYESMLDDTTDPDIRANITQLIGQTKLAMGDREGAAQAYTSLIASGTSPETIANGHFGLAELAREEGRTEDATQSLRTVITSSADPVLKAIALESLAGLYQSTGDLGEARIIFAEIIDLLPTSHPQAFSARLGLAQLYVREAAYQQAITLYRVAQKESTSEDQLALAKMGEAEALSVQGKDTEALAIYQDMVQGFTERPDLLAEARLGLARALEATGDIEGALRQYQTVAEGDASSASALQGSQGWVRALESLGRSKEADAIRTRLLKETAILGETGLEGRLRAAEARAQAGATEEAITAFNGILKDTNDDTLRLQALDGKARALMEGGQLEPAVEAFEELIEASASNPDYQYNAYMGLAGVLRPLGRRGEARSTYQLVADKSSDLGLKAWALESIAQMDLEAGDSESAEAKYRLILNQAEDPTTANGARMGLAQMKRSAGDPEGARALLKKVQSTTEDRGQGAWAGLYIAQTYMDEEAHDEALEGLLDVIQTFPEEKEVVLNGRLSLADLYRARGRLEEASAAYRSVADGRSFPEYRVSALLGIAATAQDNGDTKLEKDAYDEILRRFKDLEEASFNARLGQARLQMKEGQQGAEDACQTLKTLADDIPDPTLKAFALHALAQAMLYAGDEAGAQQAYAELLDTAANLPDLKSEASEFLEDK